ncbi:glycoside hydrolase family 15 protein, partial [Lentzea roselyniae]
RYCWLRDAAMTAAALVSLGSFDEAEGFLAWLHGVLATVQGPERLHPLYTLHGTQLGAEAVIDTLPGYAGSRPVRVGNLANQQVQLDVLAEPQGNGHHRFGTVALITVVHGHR